MFARLRHARGDGYELGDECCDRGRVELSARALVELGKCRFDRELSAVDAVVRYRVEGVGDEDDARAERNVLSVQAVGIAGAVPAFVMVEHPLGYGVDAQALEHSVSDLR